MIEINATTVEALTLVSVVIGNLFTFLNTRRGLKNQLAIEELHACVDRGNRIAVASAARQSQMHAENMPVIRETLATVQTIKATQAEDNGSGK